MTGSPFPRWVGWLIAPLILFDKLRRKLKRKK